MPEPGGTRADAAAPVLASIRWPGIGHALVKAAPAFALAFLVFLVAGAVYAWFSLRRARLTADRDDDPHDGAAGAP